MPINSSAFEQLNTELASYSATLVAVSKMQPQSAIEALYKAGQLDFGENYVQELLEKQEALPKEIRWHFIGHLQSNKVKFIAPFIHLIHGVDSLKLLKEINKEAGKNKRIIQVLLQVHIAQESTKFGLNAEELAAIVSAASENSFPNLQLRGLMGMASFSDNPEVVENEFKGLKMLFDQYKPFFPEWNILSMGMSGDYKIALKAGSTMVRIGSLLFGARMNP